MSTATGYGLSGYGPELSAAGSGLDIFALLAQSVQAGKRARAIADYTAQVSEANATAEAQAADIQALQYTRQAAMARQDQAQAAQAQAWREARQQDQNERILGQTRAIIGASGILFSGSPLAAYEETIRQQQLDVLAGRYQTALQVRASGEQATQAEYASQLATYGAGERLRIGRQAGALARAQADDNYLLAGFNKAAGAGLKGLATYGYLKEKQQTGLLH